VVSGAVKVWVEVKILVGIFWLVDLM